MTENTTKILDKVKKLLALSGSANEAESAAASDPFGDLVAACDRSAAAFRALRAGAVAVHDAAEELAAYCKRVVA